MQQFKIDRDLRGLVSKHKGGNGKDLSYLSWFIPVGMAGSPEQRVVEFDQSRAELEVFGGAVVAVDHVYEDNRVQRIYLPIQDNRFRPIEFANLTARDVGDAISRCRAKAIACTTGIGLDLYANFAGDGQAFAEALGKIGPTTNLQQVEPVVKVVEETQAEYIEWPFALAAAMLADPHFLWEVETRELIDRTTGEVIVRPYKPSGTGYSVGLTVTYRGRKHTEWLPIMGTAMVQTARGLRKLGNQSLQNPTSSDWNKSVMRALTKSISVASGYGLAVYAKMDAAPEAEQEAEEQPTQQPRTQPAVRSVPKTGTRAVAPRQPAQPPKQRIGGTVLEQIKALATKTGTEVGHITAWLGVDSLDKATDADRDEILRLLQAKQAKMVGRQAAAA